MIDDMYIDQSLTETTEILFECPECDFISGEIWERCPECGWNIPENYNET